MPYGTDAFTDGYGDFKQPTIVDYDKETVANVKPPLSEEEKNQIENQYKRDQETALSNILNTNPYYAGDYYQHLVFAKDSKLVWDKVKIDSLKNDVNWLFNLSRYLDKRKKLILK